ncbi:unnamed protein product [Psylliodes chrysocephalus]|uniref:Uncharacterized protein n=1 Tax=Psylliodes chrysocephalus TaxID=3402493 RepID=A0A9P0GI10_9CUCU|nr:unnamed protein product [Psylliodes chrysocephala]
MGLIEKKSCKNVSDNMTINELYNRLVENNTKQTAYITGKIDHSIEQLTNKLEATYKKIEILENCVNMKRKLRRNNIAIFGLVIKYPILENTLQPLNNLLGINLNKNDINFIRIPKEEHEKLPIIIEFIFLYKKQTVFQNVQKVKNSKISIAYDRCYQDRNDYKVLKRHLNIAEDQNLPAKIKGRTIEINGNIYTINDLHKIERQCETNKGIRSDSDFNRENDAEELVEEKPKSKGKG